MSTDTTLEAKSRKRLGSSESRRLRRQGQVPANIYGHKHAPVTVSLDADSLRAVVATGHKVLDITVDGASETVMLRDLQWDPFGLSIQHVDLLRVDADERVEVEVAIDIRGISPGLQAGGVMDMHMRTLTIECPAIRIPDHIVVNMNHLEIGSSVHVKDLVVPEGIKVLDDEDELVLQIVQPSEVSVEGTGEPGEGGPVQPEIVAKERKGAEAAE